MVKTLSYDAQLPDMFNTLMEDGVFKVDNYLDGDILQQLHDDVLDKCTNEAGHYEFGRNYRGDNILHIPQTELFSKCIPILGCRSYIDNIPIAHNDMV